MGPDRRSAFAHRASGLRAGGTGEVSVGAGGAEVMRGPEPAVPVHQRVSRVRWGYIHGMIEGTVRRRSVVWRLAAAGALALAVAGGCERKTRDTDIKIISLAEMKTLLDQDPRGERGQIVLVDPRPAASFEAGHIPGARNVQLPQIDTKGSGDPSLSRFRNIVVYGEDPGSAVARGMTKRLMAVGHRGVRLYAGGMREWRSRGYDVQRVERPTPAPGEAAPE
jgi:rhodanese-related sulfurtransferase